MSMPEKNTWKNERMSKNLDKRKKIWKLFYNFFFCYLFLLLIQYFLFFIYLLKHSYSYVKDTYHIYWMYICSSKVGCPFIITTSQNLFFHIWLQLTYSVQTANKFLFSFFNSFKNVQSSACLCTCGVTVSYMTGCYNYFFFSDTVSLVSLQFNNLSQFYGFLISYYYCMCLSAAARR